MAEVHVAFEWTSAVLPWVVSFVGSLLGIPLATKARFRRGAVRGRLVAYASVALGGVAIWQMHVISLLSVNLPGLTLRLSPLWTAASLVIAVASAALALLVMGCAAPHPLRLAVAGILLGSGILATHFVALVGVRVGGTLDYEAPGTLAFLLLTAVATTAMLWSIVAVRSARSAVSAAAGTAAALTAMHYAAMWAVCVHIGKDDPGVTGTSPLLAIVLVTLVGGAATAMLAYFAFGRSTMHDIRAIYLAPEAPSGALQPATIAEVTTRIAQALVPTLLPAELLTGDGGRHRRPPGPRPTPGITPAWRSMPVWGSAAPRRSAMVRSLAATPEPYPVAPSPPRHPPAVYKGSSPTSDRTSDRTSDTQLSLQRNRRRFPGNS